MVVEWCRSDGNVDFEHTAITLVQRRSSPLRDWSELVHHCSGYVGTSQLRRHNDNWSRNNLDAYVVTYLVSVASGNTTQAGANNVVFTNGTGTALTRRKER